MHLVIYAAGEQVFAFTIYFNAGSCIWRKLWPYLFYPAICQQHIGSGNLPFIHQLYILNQVFLHILFNEN